MYFLLLLILLCFSSSVIHNIVFNKHFISFDRRTNRLTDRPSDHPTDKSIPRSFMSELHGLSQIFLTMISIVKSRQYQDTKYSKHPPCFFSSLKMPKRVLYRPLKSFQHIEAKYHVSTVVFDI